MVYIEVLVNPMGAIGINYLIIVSCILYPDSGDRVDGSKDLPKRAGTAEEASSSMTGNKHGSRPASICNYYHLNTPLQPLIIDGTDMGGLRIAENHTAGISQANKTTCMLMLVLFKGLTIKARL